MAVAAARGPPSVGMGPAPAARHAAPEADPGAGHAVPPRRGSRGVPLEDLLRDDAPPRRVDAAALEDVVDLDELERRRGEPRARDERRPRRDLVVDALEAVGEVDEIG